MAGWTVGACLGTGLGDVEGGEGQGLVSLDVGVVEDASLLDDVRLVHALERVDEPAAGDLVIVIVLLFTVEPRHPTCHKAADPYQSAPTSSPPPLIPIYIRPR